MPSKNILKPYIKDGYYHIYNRGVEKRDIFLDEFDCKVFLFYLKIYLSPIEDIKKFIKAKGASGLRLQRFINKNLSSEIDLLSFSLMPNHIHLQIKQHTETAIIKFMRQLMTSYVMYFNKKYKRVGSLFQSRYKARLLKTDVQLIHVSRYININPRGTISKIDFAKYSSYPYYLGLKTASWVKPGEILSYFQSGEKAVNNASNQGRTLATRSIKDGPLQKHGHSLLTYRNFVESYKHDSQDIIDVVDFEVD